MEKTIKEKQKVADKWCRDHGAARINIKTRDIYLYDGGLFALVEKTKMLHRIIRWEKLPEGCLPGYSQAIFSKRRYPTKIYEANLWIEELSDTIRYFQSMKRMLKNIGYNTDGRPRIKTNKRDTVSAAQKNVR